MKQPNARVFHVVPKSKQTLLDALHHHLSGLICPDTAIRSGGVWIGQERQMSPNRLVIPGNAIKVYQSPTQGYSYAFSEELIVQETNDWVVVMKEPLITIGMDRSNVWFNLMAGLNAHYGVSDFSKGVQPITRLDYRVAGLCLFSKHKSSERRLFQQMQQRRIKKRYLAMVDSRQPIKHRCEVNLPLGFTHKAMVTPNGKPSKTRFVYRSTLNDYVHVYHALARTGRRHQVRIHAQQSIGSLVNDEYYGASSFGRHATIGLVASDIRFYWNGQWVCVTLPKRWEDQALTWLRHGDGYIASKLPH